MLSAITERDLMEFPETVAANRAMRVAVFSSVAEAEQSLLAS